MSKITRRRIYLGIEVHKKTYSVTAVCEGYIVKRACMLADPVTLLNFIKYHFPNDSVKSVYEDWIFRLELTSIS